MNEIHNAIKNKQNPLLTLLLNTGHDPNEQATEEWGVWHGYEYPIMLAFETKNYDAVEILLDNGADEAIALKDAYFGRKPDIINFFSKRGVKPENALCQKLLLHHFIEKGKENAAATYINNGQYITEKDKNGLSTTEIIIHHRRYKVFIALINTTEGEKSISWKNIYDMLHWAFSSSEYKAAEKILEKYHEIEYFRNKFMNRLLFKGAKNGHKQMIEMLLDYGADINATNENQVTPIFLLASRNHSSLMQDMIDRGAIYDIVNDLNITPLIEAAKNNATEVVELLIIYGVDTQTIDWEGNNALDYARKNENTEIEKLLLNVADPAIFNPAQNERLRQRSMQIKSKKIRTIIKSLKFYST